jgi:DNA-directed RNA polymerase subunit RPC12/RpoP
MSDFQEKFPKCKTCGREMSDLEFNLRKAECVLCKTKRELNL